MNSNSELLNIQNAGSDQQEPLEPSPIENNRAYKSIFTSKAENKINSKMQN